MQDLQALVWAKLEESALETQVALLVGASLVSRDAIEHVLAGESPLEAEPREDGSAGQSPGMYLQSVRVAGFRGIGPEARLGLVPGPGLNVIAGRNGSGKSSFAEAVEFAFTGQNRRWTDVGSVAWKEGWRNLHSGERPRIQVDLAVEGKPGPTKVVREWRPDAELEDHEAWVQHHGEPRVPLGDLGWNQLLSWYRPFLPYSELGSMLQQGPSALYDAMTAMLGLDRLVDAQKCLANARLQRKHEAKDARDELERLKPALHDSDDERAVAALKAVSGRDWDLKGLSELVLGGDQQSTDSELALLRQITALEPPDLQRVGEAAQQLRDAAGALDQVRGTDADRARALAHLLEKALAAHGHYALERCPVCDQGRLDGDWKKNAQHQIEQLRQEAGLAEEAHRAAEDARGAALRLLEDPPRMLADAGSVGLDAGDVRVAYSAWAAGRERAGDLGALADHLEHHALGLVEHVEALRTQASKELERRENAWQPVAAGLASWLPKARRAQRRAGETSSIQAAETWLKAQAAEIRDERFEPIAQHCRAVWGTLRQRSNVELGRVVLEGGATRRRVALDVTVDGVPGAAVGVMSQGELHALALSLFLPRATLDDSPFRFVVIDDPVQSMDPSRVDGLARALQECARHRQVLVFTHDERLPESLRRLGVDARILQVDRVSGSQVSVRSYLDPVERYLDDAWAVARTEELPSSLAGSVIPGLCRMALEAACHEVCRRRWIGHGARHAEVEERLQKADKLNKVMTLALFDDDLRGGEVLSRLNRYGRWAGDAYQACNRGAHRYYQGDLSSLVSSAGELAARLRALS